MSSNRPRIRFALGLMAIAALGLLGGCASADRSPAADIHAATAADQYPLKAREIPGELKLAVHSGGLSPAQRDALADLADRWTESGGGDVLIRVPSAGSDPRAADLTSGEAMDFLGAMGVPPARIHRVSYAPAAPGEAPIVVAYRTYRALVPRCGLEWENLTSNGQNRPMKNFGCATSANLAAQIANPADIAGTRTLDATDAGRRTTVIEAYRQGKSTAAAEEKGANGTLSSMGGSN